MKSDLLAKESFRKGFVLVMTLLYIAAFLALVGGFLQSLLLAAIFSGLVYPLYLWFVKITGGRTSLASILTLLVSLLMIIIPLLFLLVLVADQAVGITEVVKPWISEHLAGSELNSGILPAWFPFAEKLAPYSSEILAKIGELAGMTGSMIASSLAKISEGAAIFFLNLFIMLYSMYFFLLSGRTLTDKILSYLPLTRQDEDKMIEVGLSVSRATIKGTLIIGIIQGTLGGLGFWVSGVGSAVFWAAVMAVLSVLPGIGAMLVWGPAVIYLFITGNTVAGLGLLAWCAGVVGTVDNVLRPILVGRDAQMPDLLILLSTLGGIGLFGASGLVLGPILAALFLTVLAIYTRVFAEWLKPDETLAEDTDSNVSVSGSEPKRGEVG
ncbi:MAG: putative PurR-regulated permease PerM [Desulforhopalus sp.]|jgi:predicted PurR-regulated permease PerM